jgi:hypothetical protein
MNQHKNSELEFGIISSGYYYVDSYNPFNE